MKYLALIAIFYANIALISAQEFIVFQQVSGYCRDFHDHLIATSDGMFDIGTGDKLIDTGDIQDIIHGTNYVMGNDRIYDLVSGDVVVTIDNQIVPELSPDGAYFAVNGVGVYDVATWELHIIPDDIYFEPIFSPDGQYILLGSSLYDLSTAEIVLDDVAPGNGISGQFSPAGTYLVDPSRGVFNLSTWEWVYEGEPFPEDPNSFWVSALQDAVFSPDETLLAMFNGVFSTNTWERVFETNSGRGIMFSSDGNYLHVGGDAVYDTTSGQSLFEIEGYGLFTSDAEILIHMDATNRMIEAYDLKDGSLRWSTRSDKELYYNQYRLNEDDTVLMIPNNAIYDLASGEKIYNIPAYSRFSQDGSLIASDDGLVDAHTGQVIWHADVVTISDDNAYLAVQEDDGCTIYAFEDN